MVDVLEGIEDRKIIANTNQNLSLSLNGSTIPNGKCKWPRVDIEQPLSPRNLVGKQDERYLNDKNVWQHGLKGDKAERNAKRNKLLRKLMLCNDHSEKHLNLIGRLIDVEESFII